MNRELYRHARRVGAVPFRREPAPRSLAFLRGCGLACVVMLVLGLYVAEVCRLWDAGVLRLPQ